jgi:NAD-dependent dihydropyrimidine dehydrogenase PreA subunit
MTRKILLRYSPEKTTEPILASAIKETGLLLNILYAKVDTRGGEILIAVDAPDEETDEVIERFKRKGIEVREIKRAIQLDRDLCFDCGACLSLCPTGALYQTGDSTVEVEEDTCIYCELCVPACPVRALKLLEF